MATLAKSSDEIIKGLLGDLENENGHQSEATESSSGDEEEERKKKRKKEKKHKKSKKKKKKKHKRSSRSRSRSRNRDGDSEDGRERKKKKSDKNDVSKKPDNIKRVSRPLSPPVLQRSHHAEDDYEHHELHEQRSRRVPPPPPPEEWVRGDHFESRSVSYREDDDYHRSRRHSRHSSERSHHYRSHSRDRLHTRREDSHGRPDDRHSNGERRSRSRERHSRRNADDPFWESKWEASEVQKKADEKEKRGRHFLAPDKSKVQSRSESRDRDSTPETEEAKTIQKLRDIQDLVVKDEEKYVAEPPNPDMFEWDEKPEE